jgi:hypothetical protein
MASWETIDAFVKRFEEAWQKGGRPAIDDFLPVEGPDRPAVLIELVHVDLERRLEAGESARADDYLKRYPELGPVANTTQLREPSRRKQGNDSPVVLPLKIAPYRVTKESPNGVETMPAREQIQSLRNQCQAVAR